MRYKGKEIGIIGYGRFGKFISGHLSKDFNLFVFDKNLTKHSTSDNSQERGLIKPLKNTLLFKKNVKFTTLREAAGKDIVILATSISSIEEIVKKIKSFVKKDAIIIDVCSVKEYPVKIMKKFLPGHVSIIGSHPLFGPDSAGKSLMEKIIIFCPVRISKKRMDKVIEYLHKKGLVVIKTTPKKHDEQTALTLCLTHFLGRGLASILDSRTGFDTLTYKDLLNIKETVMKDSKRLFLDMHIHNRFTSKMREKIINDLIEIDKKIKLEKSKNNVLINN